MSNIPDKKKKSDIGVYGLGVMGKNLALNFEEKGNTVSLYNRKVPGEQYLTDEFLAFEGLGKKFRGCSSPESLVSSLERPRKILMMVKAGEAVDEVIGELIPWLEPGDILIDGGNSHYRDTVRRIEELAEKEVLFVGMGISGGKEGARSGPSLMPGGRVEAWAEIEPLLMPVAARAYDDSPCCVWTGSGGAGHFVKMVHNGIEYADMQMIAETYDLMMRGLGMNAEQIASVFSDWNDTELSGYLMEITVKILQKKEPDGFYLIDRILDAADQKGTGRWVSATALELGIPLPVITESVHARFTSGLTEIRRVSSSAFQAPYPAPGSEKENEKSLLNLAQALYAARLTATAEGFYLITKASKQFGWGVDPAEVARIWQGGCIIRSELLREIELAFRHDITLEHLMLSPYFKSSFKKLLNGWRKTASMAVTHGIPAPAITSALAQFDSVRSFRLPANLIQAQRDYFGAHTYQRIDRLKGKSFTTEWE
ncbi:MAG: decarboxylating NADP(+)-dependent phosphogluconate dehydrogenase [Balneolaceae bacterium]|nr:MAG: decarboxylating NADP(+)-dependent phosphogluconate dehydrogenase [Balneolaceae bacterium]